jgi:hypothetical protein
MYARDVYACVCVRMRAYVCVYVCDIRSISSDADEDGFSRSEKTPQEASPQGSEATRG